ncbi:hypothetical protein NE850_23360 [Paraburkholderia sp. USG1]|uniref:hypothetical protein n=1 Tax=Paraburkholderia sp. USG1 TaxID=2952268 RepID=UPI0028668803|nr:hypothetical protein [Paraburkholderia sp. USG1]MDR8399263.1 hypothetical protein [Paraburkholderia sp. USG1]
MKKIITAAVLFTVGLPMLAIAQSAPPPALKTGDTWTYVNTFEKAPSVWRQTHDEVSVLRATSAHIYYASKPVGSTQAPNELIAGADWSRERSVNGTEVVVNRPLAFPLSPGKTWSIDYAEQHPNKMHASEKWSTQYRVVDTETVEVPAGKFQAIKVEAEGNWTAQLEPTQTVTQAVQVQQGDTAMVTHAQKTGPVQATGRTYKAIWYVPEIGRWVKSVEEYYASNGVRNERYTSELESFKRSAE